MPPTIICAVWPAVNLTESQLLDGPKAPASISCLRSASAFLLAAEFHTVFLPPSASVTRLGPATRSYRYSNHISVGHWSPPPSAIGTCTPLLLSVLTSLSSWLQVLGAERPSLLSSDLL